MGDEFTEPFDSSVNVLYDAIGLLGVALYLGTYAALQLGLVEGRGRLYPSLNTAAASCILISLIPVFHWPSAVIQVAWISIGVFGLVRIYVLSRRAIFTDEERELIAETRVALPRHLARRLLDCGAWRDLPAGTVLTRQGTPLSHLYFLTSGRAEAEVNGRVVAHLRPGDYIGDIAVLEDAPSVGTSTVTEDARGFAFDAVALRRLVSKNEEVADALEASFLQNLKAQVLAAVSPRTRAAVGRTAP